MYFSKYFPRKLRSKRTSGSHLDSLLLEIDDDADAEVLVRLLNANQTSGLEKRDQVLRFHQPEETAESVL
jgi:hypothetical protein